MHGERVSSRMLQLHRKIYALVGIPHARDRKNRHHLLGPEQGMIVIHLADTEANAVVATDARLLQDDAGVLADERAVDLGFLSRAMCLFEDDLRSEEHTS